MILPTCLGPGERQVLRFFTFFFFLSYAKMNSKYFFIYIFLSQSAEYLSTIMYRNILQSTGLISLLYNWAMSTNQQVTPSTMFPLPLLQVKKVTSYDHLDRRPSMVGFCLSPSQVWQEKTVPSGDGACSSNCSRGCAWSREGSCCTAGAFTLSYWCYSIIEEITQDLQITLQSLDCDIVWKNKR